MVHIQSIALPCLFRERTCAPSGGQTIVAADIGAQVRFLNSMVD